MNLNDEAFCLFCAGDDNAKNKQHNDRLIFRAIQLKVFLQLVKEKVIIKYTKPHF